MNGFDGDSRALEAQQATKLYLDLGFEFWLLTMTHFEK